MKTDGRGSDSTAPCILNLGTRWNRAVTVHRPL